MKFYFVINPVAGSKEEKNKIEEYIKKVCSSLEYEIYYTSGKGDATKFVNEHRDEVCSIFACGGDGTIHEVINGAVYSKVHVGIYPCGSGNDFVRIFDDVKNLERLIKTESKKVDTISVNGEYSINVINIGFDAAVNGSVDRFKKKHKVTTAYNMSIIYNLLKRMNHHYTIKIDGEEVKSGKFLLMSLGNASYYGGGFKCAPNAVIDDGLIEFCAVRKIGRLTLAKIINKYKEGTHLTDPRLKKIILYKRCKKVEIMASREFDVSMDGENVKVNRLVANIEEKSINLIYNKE